MDPETVMDASARLAALEAQVGELSGLVERQAAEIRALRAGAPNVEAPPGLVAPDAAGPVVATPGPGIGRRRLLLGGAGAAVAATAAVVAGATPAAANNGDPLTLGSEGNAASSPTALTTSGTDFFPALTIEATGPYNSALRAEAGTALKAAFDASGPGGGVYGSSTQSSGVYGYTYAAGQVGVLGRCSEAFVADGVKGESSLGRGVVGTSASGNGVEGGSTDAIGVRGTSDTWLGMQAYSNSGVGLQAGSGEAAAIEAVGVTAPAIIATSPWSNLSLTASPSRPAPTADGMAHDKGEIVEDANGNLWVCVADGTPGTWRKVAGPSTAGAFHLLPVPVRVYDSRPGTPPNVGSKTPLSPNTARVLSMSANASGVPAGATAVSVTLLLVNASTAGGNLTLWANGASRPSANAMVWGGTARRFASTAICRIDAATKLNVAASATTDLVLDVVGYYL